MKIFLVLVIPLQENQRNQRKKKGWYIPEIAKKKSKVLVKNIAESVTAFYEDDQFSRNCPGKKEFVIVRINGEKVHKQKHLLLVNFKELNQEFKKSCNKDKSLSKFCELHPEWCIPVSSASGAHSVYVGQIHQKTKLMAYIIPSKELENKTTKNLKIRTISFLLNCQLKSLLRKLLLILTNYELTT